MESLLPDGGVQKSFWSIIFNGMKIVQINSVCGRGSTGKICVAVSELLSKKGVENYILYSRWLSDYPIAIKYEDDHYAKWQALREKVFGTYGFEAKSATRKLIKNLEEIKPDIVHLHILHCHDCNLTMLFDYLRKKHIKVFWTFHDCWAITGYCPHFDMINCTKWKENCGHCPDWKRFSWFFDRSKEMQRRKKAMVDGLDLTIITPSEWLAGVVKKSFMKDFPIKVINNGIDLNVFKPIEHADSELDNIKMQYGLTGKKIILGVADVWSVRKGLPDFIRLRERLDDSFVIVLVGVTRDVQKNLPKGILGIQRTQNQQELALMYAAADVFVNPTYEENYPTTNLESMACGTPVITYRTGGSPEMLTPDTGWVVNKGDVDALVDVIQSIDYQNLSRRKKCLERAQEFFAKESCFEKYAALYYA